VGGDKVLEGVSVGRVGVWGGVGGVVWEGRGSVGEGCGM